MLSQYLKQCCLIINPAVCNSVSAIHTVTAGLEVRKMVFTHSVECAENWKKLNYLVTVQEADSFHHLWKKAYSGAFDEGFRKVILLHTAPQGLEQQHLEEAFLSLRILELCMGPLKDGGLYMSGMNQYQPEILENNMLEPVPQWKTFQRSAGTVKAALYKTPLF